MNAVRAAVLVRESEGLASESAADLFVSSAMRSTFERGVFNVAIPGGSSPRGMFTLLAQAEWSRHVPWEWTHIFFTDERCVPPDSRENNYKQAHDLLLSRTPIPEAKIHRFETELPPDQAAAAYEAVIRAALGSAPVFDLVILGMGADTHTASLFPHTPALEESEKLAAANWVEKLAAWRLTLTIPMLCAAREVVVLAFGESKAEAVRTALQGPVDVHAHPVQAVRPPNSRLVWVLDQPAASLL